MERVPSVIVIYDEHLKRYRVHALHIVLNGIASYLPVAGLSYEHASDAVREAAEYRPDNLATRMLQHTQNVVDRVNKAMGLKT